MKENFNPDFLVQVTPENFLPPISKWTSIGGMVMLTAVVSAIASASIFKYPVVVKAPFQVRPQRELAVVQTFKPGKVKKVSVQNNQVLSKGDVIVSLDDSLLQQNKQQLQLKIDYIKQTINKLKIQIAIKERQAVSQIKQIERNIASLQGEINLTKNNHQKAIIDLTTNFKEAQSNFNLAEDELTRYEYLANTGAISLLQLSEKKAAYDTAKARLEKFQKQVNPSNDEIIIAQEKLAEEKERKETQLLLLKQEEQQLSQELLKNQAQLDNSRQELIKIKNDIDLMIIRSPISGTIQELKINNPEQVLQVGDEIVKIFPRNSNLSFQAAVPTSQIKPLELTQKVQLKVHSCPYTDYGTLKGKIIAIAPDATYPQNLQEDNYYRVTIKPDAFFLSKKQEKCLIQSGMNGQAEIITKQESLLSLILRQARLFVDF